MSRMRATAGILIAAVLCLPLGVMLLLPSTTEADAEPAPRADQAAPAADPSGSPPVEQAAQSSPAVPEPVAPVVPAATTGQASGAHEVTAAAPVEPAESPLEARQAEHAAASGQERRQEASAAAGRRLPEKSARASAGSAVQRPSDRKAPEYRGSLAIRSEPSAAVVSVDGRVVGSTPIVLDAIAIGSRVVRIEAPGYERWSSVARVVANRKTSIDASLKQSGR